uniref:Rab effector MyRIP/Melanophilin domain-containing protein n=1 Tax=Terrapene triunguis TaxID=2587831 RepID=A0A674IKF4_9SAUR
MNLQLSFSSTAQNTMVLTERSLNSKGVFPFTSKRTGIDLIDSYVLKESSDPFLKTSCVYTEFCFLALFMLSKMRKTKRLLSVHPFDFELDSEYSAQSRRQSVQLSQTPVNQDGHQVLGRWLGTAVLSFLAPFLSSLPRFSCLEFPRSPAPESHTDADVEEEELKRKLEELASNISDKGVSSEEEEEKKKGEPKPEMSSSRSDPPSDVCTTAGKTSGLDQTPRDLEERARHSGTTDSELSELEDKVASAAVQMQRAESEVSDIESRIAALSAAGLTVKPVEKPKKKYSTQVSVSINTTNVSYFIFYFCKDGDESFDRNSIYRGSLTQRNPNGKNRKADRVFAKPVMTHRP